jgi:hypothetical protein
LLDQDLLEHYDLLRLSPGTLDLSVLEPSALEALTNLRDVHCHDPARGLQAGLHLPACSNASGPAVRVPPALVPAFVMGCCAGFLAPESRSASRLLSFVAQATNDAEPIWSSAALSSSLESLTADLACAALAPQLEAVAESARSRLAAWVKERGHHALRAEASSRMESATPAKRAALPAPDPGSLLLLTTPSGSYAASSVVAALCLIYSPLADAIAPHLRGNRSALVPGDLVGLALFDGIFALEVTDVTSTPSEVLETALTLLEDGAAGVTEAFELADALA